MAATYVHQLRKYTDVQTIIEILGRNQFNKDGTAHQRVNGRIKLTVNWGRDGNPNQLTQRVNQITFRLANIDATAASTILNELF